MPRFKLRCFCGEEKGIYYPVGSDKVSAQQLEWIMEHLIEHQGMYYEKPFSTKVRTIRVEDYEED